MTRPPDPTPPGPVACGIAVASALAAAGREPELATHCDAWLAAGLPAEVLAEALLCSYLFAGYPRAINALGILRAREAAAGRAPALPPQEPPLDAATARARGEALCRRIYGPLFPTLVRQITALHPVLATQMIEEGYGRILARPGLEPVWREYAAIGALAALGTWPQCRAHLRGARNLGATAADLRGLLDALAPVLGPEAAATAARTLAEVEGR